MNPIILDGSLGEGGGQILRTALALSVLTRIPFRIENIRANREKPGLLRQHLTAVKAAAQICAARVEGDILGSRTLSFAPGELAPGDYTFAIGSAGSTTLVLQTVLPPLMVAGKPSTLTLEGGTHNPLAPPFEFLQASFLPLIRRMGPAVEAHLACAGFYPAGGGRMTVSITPSATLAPLSLTDFGQIARKTVTATVVGLPRHIAEREIAFLAKRLAWPPECFRVVETPATCGPGNYIAAELQNASCTEVLSAIGRKGITAETIAEDLARQVRAYLQFAAPVGEHLADQLLIPMALAGGTSRFVTGPLSGHAQTNLQVIGRFLPVRIAAEEIAPSQTQVTVAPQ